MSASDERAAATADVQRRAGGGRRRLARPGEAAA